MNGLTMQRKRTKASYFVGQTGKKCFLLLLLLMSVLYGKAQIVYTLDSCKAMAARDNLTVQNKRLAVEAARQQKMEVFTKFFPAVSAMGAGFWLTNPMIDMDYDLGKLQLPLFSPVMISIDLPSIPMQMINGGIMGGVTAVQPLFAGLRIVRGNQLAKLGYQAAELQLKLSEDEVSTEVETYFWKIVTLKEKQKMLEALDRQLSHIAEDADAAVAAGVIKPSDRLQVELKRQELESGRIKVANGIRVCKMMLRQYARIPERDFDIQYDTLLLPDSPESYYMESTAAVGLRTESQLLDMQVKAAELQTQMEIGKHLPQVAVGAGYSAYLMDVNEYNTSSNHFGMVFGTVTVPISDWWGGGHAIKRCRINEQIARNEREQNLQLLEIQTEQTWNELYEAYQQLLISQQSVRLSEENLRLQNDYYEAGTTTLSDLLNAQSQLLQSTDSFTEAYSDYQLKLSSYLKRSGR